MAAIQIEIIQSPQFIAGNLETNRVSHQTVVNTFLSGVSDPQNVLQLDQVLQPIGSNLIYKTVIVYYQP